MNSISKLHIVIILIKFFLSITILFFSGCTPKEQDGKVTYGLNSCFELAFDESLLNSDQYAEKFYREHCETKNVPLALNRVIRSNDNGYIFICMATDSSLSHIPSAIVSDSTLHETKVSKGLSNIGNIHEYYQAIGYRNEYWLYYFTYFDLQLKHPFVIIFSEKNRKTAESYFSSVNLIKKRLDCSHD